MICSAFQIPINPITKKTNSIITISNRRLNLNRIKQSENYFLHSSKPTVESAMMKMAVNRPNDAVLLTSDASGRISALFSPHALRCVWRLIGALLLIVSVPFRGRRRFAAAAAVAEERSTGKVVRVPAGVVVPRRSAVDKEVAARRATAIRRVVEGDDGGDDNTVREFDLVTSSRGDVIFTQSWTPLKVQVRGLVVLMHGLNEHSGRYDEFAKKLNANGFKVYGMDWIGHGGSDGLHAYVHSLDYAVNDMKMFLTKVLAENPGVPCFCFGHSTGGAIVLKAVLDPKVRQHIAGIVLTSPAVGVQPSHPIFAVLAPVFSFLLPRFQFSAANKRGIAVSRDPDALVAKYSDPLVFTGSIRVRTGYEILRITSYLQHNLNRLTVPFFVLHGMSDSVTDPQASQKLYEEACSTDKTIKLYEGLLHDLLFEPEKEEITESIIKWLDSRV